MHKNIFPLFIVSLGIVTAYVFYAVWHIEEPTLNNPTIQASKETSQAESINKEYTKSIASKDATVKTIPSPASSQNKITNKEEPNVSSLVYETPEEIQETYEALTPESHDDTVAEAQTAFASIDDTVLEMQEHLDTQMMETEQTE